VKGRYLISLLLPLLLLCGSCTPQTEKKGVPEKIASEKTASSKKKPLKIIHVAGETISVNLRAGKLTIRGKDGDIDIYTTEKTIIHVGRDKISVADIAAGNKATVKYLEIGGKNIARSIFIVRETPEKLEPQKADIPSPQPHKEMHGNAR
jgi:hypothetical protein